MRLKHWIETHGLTVTKFAEQAGLEISTAHRAAHGKTIPSPETMRAIMRATGGEVTPNDFYEEGGDRAEDSPPEGAAA